MVSTVNSSTSTTSQSSHQTEKQKSTSDSLSTISTETSDDFSTGSTGTAPDKHQECVGQPCDTRCSVLAGSGTLDGVCSKRGRCVLLSNAHACHLQCVPGEVKEAADGCNYLMCRNDSELWKDASITDAICKPCQTAMDCGSSSLCNEGINSCGIFGTFQGSCRARPTVCSENGPAVCGCDGKRYTSTCEAHKAGVDTFNLGGCRSESPDAFRCLDSQCKASEICHIAVNGKQGPLQPRFNQSCVNPPSECDEKPSCDCVKLDVGERCWKAGDFVIVYNPGE